MAFCQRNGALAFDRDPQYAIEFMAYVAGFPGHAAVSGERRDTDKGGFQGTAITVDRDCFQLHTQSSEILFRFTACTGTEPNLQQHANPTFIPL
ncbi:hypothetical protein D3C81_1730950 [compost metagenome]